MRRIFNFDDLVFERVSPTSKKLKATLSFSNSYGCNIYMHSSATNFANPYEFELLKDGHPSSHSKISDENIGYCSKDDICSLISEAQSL